MRELVSRDEIIRHLSEELHQTPGYEGLFIEMPEFERLDPPDSDGCNWHVRLPVTAHGAEQEKSHVPSEVIHRVKARYNLAD